VSAIRICFKRYGGMNPEIIGNAELYHGDALEILPMLPPGCADMLFTDPPYGVGYRGGHFNPYRTPLVNDDDTTIYGEFLIHILRIIRGPCYMFFSDKKGCDVYKAIEENKFEIHAVIIWHKINATYAAMGAQYKQRHEPILYFTPSGVVTRWCGSSRESTIWEFRREAQNNFHPTQKPPTHARKAIRNHDINSILDPFMGSGSFGVAAAEEGKSFIGIEICQEYFDIACKRIEGAQAQGKLFNKNNEVISK